jgi:hypothetical protein
VQWRARLSLHIAQSALAPLPRRTSDWGNDLSVIRKLRIELKRLLSLALVALLLLNGCALLEPIKETDMVGSTTIVDADTGAPLEGVHIFVKCTGTYRTLNLGSKSTCEETDANVKTDVNGKFVLTPFNEIARIYPYPYVTVTRVIAHYKPGYCALSDDGKVVKMKKEDRDARTRYIYLKAIGGGFTCAAERKCRPSEMELLTEIDEFRMKSRTPGTVTSGMSSGPLCKP